MIYSDKNVFILMNLIITGDLLGKIFVRGINKKSAPAKNRG